MAKPTKSAWGLALALAFSVVLGRRRAASAAACCGEGLPKIFVMSPVAVVFVFSRTMLALAMARTSHLSRVQGTQGGGTLLPSGPTMLGTEAVPAAVSVSFPWRHELGRENVAGLEVRR